MFPTYEMWTRANGYRERWYQIDRKKPSFGEYAVERYLLTLILLTGCAEPHVTHPILVCPESADCTMLESTVSSECWTHHAQTDDSSE
jgi:hypothetical protein